MKQLREKLTKEAIRDAMVAQTDGAGGSKCDLLRCPECSKNNCSYTQVSNINITLGLLLGLTGLVLFALQAQTLCSDEPMTTFAYCNDCGNRWIVSYEFMLMLLNCNIYIYIIYYSFIEGVSCKITTASNKSILLFYLLIQMLTSSHDIHWYICESARG